MSVHISPSVLTIRWYDEDEGYEKRLPYRAVCSMTIINDEEAYLYGMNGKVSRKDICDLFTKLKKYGISKVTSYRHKKKITYDIDEYLSKL